MKKLMRLSVLSVLCLSFVLFSHQTSLFSQAESNGFLRQRSHWWEVNGSDLPLTETLNPVIASGSSCDDFPGNPASPEWWAVTWMAQIDKNLDIVYLNWCDVNVQVTSDPGADVDPTFDALGTHIAFASNRDGNFDIYSVKPDRSELQKLTTNPLNDRAPDWSVLNQIVFSSGSGTVDSEIWVMNGDGSGQVQLTDNALYDVQPIWAPDGLQIFWIQISEDGENGVLWRMNRDGSNAVALTGPLLYLADPRISPNGQQIIMDMDINGDGPVDLVMMNRDGSNLHVVKQSNYDPGNPPTTVYEYWAGSWLADNSGLLFLTLSYNQSGTKYVLDTSHITFHCIDLSKCAERTFAASLYNFGPDVVNRDPLPPSSQMAPLPEYTVMPNVKLLWSGKDEGISGLAAVNVEYRDDGAVNWLPVPGFENGVPDLSGQLSVQIEQPGKFYFRMRGVDNARNFEQFPTSEEGEATTTLISGWLNGRITDNRGVPYSLKAVYVEPEGLVPGKTGLDGKFSLPVYYFKPFSLNEHWRVKTPTPLSDFYLVPGDSVIQGGGFDDPFVIDWESINQQFEVENPVIGERSTFLATSCAVEPCTQKVTALQNELPVVASIVQSVTIPLSMTHPTLSFLYRIVASEPMTSYFAIDVSREITEAQSITTTPPVSNVIAASSFSTTITTTQVFSQGEKSDWALGWVDMSQWLGESITVTFAAHEGDGVGNMIVYLDEVSLGSWKTPLPKEISPLKIDYGPAVTLTITGENFIDLPTIKLNGTVISDVVKIDNTTLEVTIPKNFSPGIYFVQVINPEGQDAIAPQLFAVGKQTYLPVIAR